VRGAPNQRRVYILVAAVCAVVGTVTLGQIRLNLWQRDFYDALAQYQVEEFLTQLLVFGVIVAVLVALQVAQTWLRETIQIDLRDAITSDVLDEWLRPRRAYLLGWTGDIARNPDQRIQEDARHLCELCAELGVGLLQASLLLISFVGVLWGLSEQVFLTIGDRQFLVPGYMVWCALAYAFAGSWATWRVGRPLVALHAEHYAREADFRFSLLHTNEAAEAVGLSGGEAYARGEIGSFFVRALAIRRRIARGLADLVWVTASHGWGVLVAPIILAAPGYFAGTLSFGELMMIAGAFLQVQTSMRWFVENFARIAEWRAALLRVMALRIALPDLDPGPGRAGRIDFRMDSEGRLALDALCVELPDRRVSLGDRHLELRRGDRVLIMGEHGSGKSMLFRAIAGLWPWGAGCIRLPPASDLMFLPQRPYIPTGTLRRAVGYPASEDRFGGAEVREAITRVGLGHLTPHLAEERRWDRELALEDQQRLAFARLLLRRPGWVVIDEPLNALGTAQRDELYGIFDSELAGTSILAIGRSRVSAPVGCRMVNVESGPADPRVRMPAAIAEPS